ncbi:MAG: ABC transporter ATP-binding protein [Bacilli bacterium]|nr:ABC transporter ATP-binding protein [Bacilli bacterium]
MKSFLKNLKISWKYMKNQRVKFFLYIFCNIIHIFISVLVPIISAQIIVKLTNNVLLQVLELAFVLFLVEIVRNVIVYFSQYFSHKIYRETFIVIQRELGKEILKIENQCIDKNSSGVFIQRLTNDTSNIADVFNVLNIYLTQVLTNVGIFGAIFIINKKVFVFVFIMITIMYFIERKRTSLYNEQDKMYREKGEAVSGFVGELVRGIRDIKMLNAEKSFINELYDKVKELNRCRYIMTSTDRNYSFLRGGFHDLFDVGMIFLLVYFIYTKEITIASALVVNNYMSRVTSLINYFGMMLDKLKSFNLSATRIFSILDSDEFTKEKFGTKELEDVKGDFEFDHVSFSYLEDRPVLKDVSFHISPKETVGFVGRSGSGKSTIFSLLCKMYDVDSGHIRIEGVEIGDLTKESIRGNITIISQNPYIFNLSIRDNLRLVKEDLTEEEMVEACRMACLQDLIDILPDGYDTIVGEGGVTLSGGQRQRLAIARALVQKTKIILFDEATSALDNETQGTIQKAINNLKKEYTVLIIAHRLSTIIDCDRILFLNHGKIEAEGKHEELLKKCDEYKKLYEAEMRK